MTKWSRVMTAPGSLGTCSAALVRWQAACAVSAPAASGPPGGRCAALDGSRSSAPAAVRRSGDAVRRMPVSAIQQPSYSDLIDERRATKEATMNSTSHRAVSRLAAVALAAVVTLATLAG